MSDKLIFTLDKDNFLDLPDFVEEIRNNQNLHYVIILVGWCLSNIAILILLNLVHTENLKCLVIPYSLAAN